jgi:beta-lactamase regulating signal transducer with metallopeptidase domain
MAESLLAVARLNTVTPPCASALTGAAASLRLRVTILVGGEQPAVPSERNVWVAYCTFLVALGIACMACELTFLDALHHYSERVFHVWF